MEPNPPFRIVSSTIGDGVGRNRDSSTGNRSLTRTHIWDGKERGSDVPIKSAHPSTSRLTLVIRSATTGHCRGARLSPTQSASQCRRGERCTCSCECDPGPKIADTGWDWRSWPNERSGPSFVAAGRLGAVAWDWLVISQSRALREKWVSEGPPFWGLMRP